MKGARTPPTMADVAAAAGVSHQTVSRVLNNHHSVAEPTRRKVHAAITALGYRRNLAARTLATGNSHIIGVLVSNTTLEGPSGALLAIEQAARSRGYWVSMVGLQSHEVPEVTEAISRFVDLGLDGIIAIAQTQRAVDAAVAGCGAMPTVLVSSGTVRKTLSRIDVDQAGGATQVMTILRGLGHECIAHVSGPPTDLHAVARADTWRAALPEGQDAGRLCVAGDWSSGSGYRATMMLLAGGTRPTAVFAANDRMALGVLRALHERGLRVPEDVSVAGFDDIAGVDCAIPPLTTIRQNHEALGQAAVELVLEAVAGQPARTLTVPAELIVRASTGVVAA